MVHFGEAGSVPGRRTLAVEVEFLCARADFGLLPLRTVLEREGLEAAGSLNGCIMADSHAPTHRTRAAVVDTTADRSVYANHTMRRPLRVMPRRTITDVSPNCSGRNMPAKTGPVRIARLALSRKRPLSWAGRSAEGALAVAA